MAPYTEELARIASDIDTLGITANETAIAMIVARSRAAGMDSVLLSVLSDATQPEVARARAFGKVATALAAVDRHPHHRDLVGTAG